MKNLVGMRLKDALKALPPSLVVSLGATYGSGFFYIGTAEEALEKAEEMYRRARPAHWAGRIGRKRPETAEQTDGRLMEMPVLDAWERLAEEGIGIRVEGKGVGGYWMKAEYDAGPGSHRKGDKMNNVCLMGRLTKDPVVMESQNGLKIARYTLAVGRRGTEKTDYISVKAFGKSAEFAEK